MQLKKIVLGIALLSASLSAGAATPLKIALTTWIGYSPFYVAEGMDMYKKYDLKVSLQTFADPAMLPSALTGKAADGALMTYDQVIGAAAQGQAFKVVMPIDYSNGGDAVLADMSINKIKDLKGKKVAYAPLSPSDFLDLIRTEGQRYVRQGHQSDQHDPRSDPFSDGFQGCTCWCDLRA